MERLHGLHSGRQANRRQEKVQSFNMSSQGAGKPREKEQEDSFYDCQETLEPSSRRVEEDIYAKSHPLTDRRDNTNRAGRSQEEEEQSEEEERSDKLRGKKQQGERSQEEEEEEQGDRLQEEEDSETKDERSHEVEFDDDYLKEAEKELTEKEKESRRQESLSLKEKGNSQFKAGDWLEAEQSYTDALVSCPVCFSRERAVVFSNRAAARLHLGLKDKAIADCSRAIELNPDYVRALQRRAELYEQTEKLDEALEDYKKVLNLDPTQTSASQACMRLPQQIQERNEKLKEEMMSKLKDLGNLVLRPFGLSTNNFQVNQDTDTGSYSINFVQNNNR
uniref:LOW QUALITY PROTEIN: tetratricopeptide repeat protein 1 n=1 Tax=Gasterosteus aculeatus aculeatus TaxID=481459 RepID=UPI001A983548|nr:LOW QUALITY PROTEIN: tetratricopeptide repeat protein 1 [Gasterosteus aculeatus aculeatus]